MPDTPLKSATPLGTIVYNGVTLNPTVSYKIASRMLYDDAGKTYKGTEYTLTGTFVVWSDEAAGVYSQSSVGTKNNTIKQRLSQPGAKLVITGIGFGDLVVNGSQTESGQNQYNDIAWGPKPDVIEFAPFGQMAWEVIWTVKYTIIEKDQGKGGKLLALNYSINFSVDERGYSSAQVSGYYEIAKSYQDVIGSTSQNLADNFKNRLDILVPQDYKLGERSFNYNAARNRVEFTYNVKELEGEAYPPGIVYADIDEDWENAVTSGGQSGIAVGNFQQWNCRIGGELEVAKGYDNTTAARKFLDLFFYRLNYIRRQAAAISNGGKNTPVVLVGRISFGCKRFTRKFRFAVEYMVSGCLPDFMKASGIYEPLNTDQTRWRGSMSQVWSNGGVSNLRMPQEFIVNVGPTQPNSHRIQLAANTVTNRGKESTLTFDCGGITEANSFLAYDNEIRLIREASVTAHKFAQAAGKETSAAFTDATESTTSATSSTPYVMNDSYGSQFLSSVTGALTGLATEKITAAALAKMARTSTPNSDGKGKSDVLEYSGTPTDYVLMTGKAMRIKYKPVAPSIEKIGNAEASLVEQHVTTPKVIATVGDCPVYVIQWAKVYYMQGGFDQSEIQKSGNPQWACDRPFG